MRKITLTFFLFLFEIGFSQSAPITFESGEPGSTWTFTTFENGGGLGYEKVANPDATGINTSATVAKFTALTTVAGAAPWAGCETKHGSDIGTFTLTTSNSTIKIMVWKSVISDVGIKFAIANGGAQPEIKVANTKINQWEELTFDFSGKIGLFETINIDQIIFFPDFQARTTENVCYFDNVTFSAKVGSTPTGTTPLTAAPTPPARNVADVKSVFSGAYADIAGTSWNENWGQSTVSEEVSIVGNATKKLSNLNYQGVVPTTGIDATGMTQLHLDIWTPDCTAFDVYLINPGPVEQKVTLTPTLSGWNSFDINLSDYTTIALNNVFQFKFVSPNQNSTVYLDNMYFYKSGTTPPTSSGAPYAPVTFESGEPGSTWTFTTFENGGGLGYEKVANPDATGINTSATVVKFTALTTLAGAAPWAGCETKHGADIGTFTLTTSNSTIKVMVWKSVISDVGIKFAIANGGAQPEIKVANTKINQWEELTFDFSGKIGLFETINIDQIIFFPDFQARTTENVCYFDNVTFSAKTGTSGGTTTSTAPTLPMDFESSTIAYSFVDFDGGLATKIANPHNTGINTSATVAQMVKGAGQPWAGSKIVLASPVDFTTNKLFKIKVWSPVAGKKLLLKFEGAGAAFEKESTGVTAANAWEELSFDFTGVAGVNNLNDNMVFIFDLGTVGDGSSNSTYLFDDVSQTTVSGGTGSTLTQMSLPTTFDDATVDYGLIGFGGAEASTVVVDPTLSTNKVVKVIKSATAELWAGTTVSAAAGLGFSSAIPFSATATKMNVRVWSPTAGIPVRLKVEDHNDNTHTVETEATVTTASGWQTLEFNFANQAAGTAALNLAFVYDKASIFFNFGTTGAVAGEKTYYFDDVAFGAAAPEVVEEPITAAPTPPARNVADVKSVFSGAYTDIAGTSWNENWGQSTVSEEVSIVGNATKKLSNLNYQGVVPTTGIDATGMTQLHLDIWTPDCTAFDVYLINPGPVEQKVTLTPTLSGWNSFDINLSDYTTIALNNVFQFKFVSPNQNSTVYIDNMYFYKANTTPVVTAPITAAPTPPARNVADVKSVFSGAYTDIAGTSWNENWGQSTVSEEVSIVGNATKKLSNLNYQGVVPTTGIDATGMTQLHLDIWTPDCTAFDVYLINPGPVEQKVTLTPTLSGWNSFDINLSDYITIALNNVFQFKFVSPNQNSTVYIDNMYFYKADTTPVVTAPITAAPTPPTRNVADVKSVFSGAYTDIAGTSWNENWGQSTVSEEVSIVGNATKKLSNLNYQGVVPTTGIDATGMTQLHLDIWTPDCTAFDVYLINPGPVEQKVTLTPTLSGWNSFDINLSDYTTIALNNVFQFKFVSPNQNSTVYLDNMYFYKEAGVEPITGIPTNLNYGGDLRFEINKDVFSVTPTVTADPFPTFSITPDMPKGMSFDTVSGSIVGKPTEENAPVSYTVTATNSVGSQQLTFTIEIFNDDHDFDGINDDVDNCSEFYNPNQEDLNNDGIGDICIEEEQVKVAQGFSPNGDGKNDVWLIKNVENHPNTQVTVFNKTGAEVFSSRDYKNLWDGSYKNTGKIVAAGSYFYQVDLGGDGSVDLQGWIYIAN